MSGDDALMYMQEDSGETVLLDPVAATNDVTRLAGLLMSGNFTEYHNLAGEALAELHAATSDAYMRLIAERVMEFVAGDLLYRRPFLEFPVMFSRINHFVMTYRRLRPDWEAEKFMGVGNG